MNEGIRFDLEYETMPWHKVDAVVFDIGNVLIRFAPGDFLERLFPGDEEKQRHMLRVVYQGPQWKLLDRGTLTYEEAARQLAAQYGGVYEEYMHAFEGWIELKTPLEEGWRAAQRCKRAGKHIYILSNYPQKAYERLREKFADLFEIFENDVVSCYLHQMKPEKEIYQTLIDACAVDPARTVFIDDRLENVQGAIKMGIHGFHMHEKGMMDRFFL